MTMVSSPGMAFGPWAGGRIFDAFNSYMWLYHRCLHRGARRGGGRLRLLGRPQPRLQVA